MMRRDFIEAASLSILGKPFTESDDEKEVCKEMYYEGFMTGEHLEQSSIEGEGGMGRFYTEYVRMQDGPFPNWSVNVDDGRHGAALLSVSLSDDDLDLSTTANMSRDDVLRLRDYLTVILLAGEHLENDRTKIWNEPNGYFNMG